MGGVIGLDHAAFYNTAEKLHYDTEALAHLLPYIEYAFLKKWQENNPEEQDDDS